MREHAPEPSAQRVVELAEQVVQQCRINPQRAARTAAVALRMAERLGDAQSLAVALRAVGNACYVSDRNTEALRHYQQAFELFLQLGQEVEAARTLSSQVPCLGLLGRSKESLERAEVARDIFERHGEVLRLARLEINRGNVFHRLDRFAEALACYDRALAGLNPETDAEALAALLLNRAVVLTSLDRYPEAMAGFQQARDFCARQGMELLVAQADYNTAWLHFLRGEYARAIELLEQARITFAHRSLYHQALCDLDQSEICLQLNLCEDALQLAGRAWHQFRQLGLGYEAARSLVNRAVALAGSGNPQRALELFGRARNLFAREKNQAWVRVVDLYRAAVYLNSGGAGEALRLASAACSYFAGNGLPTRTASARLALSRVHFSLGHWNEARAECARALQELEQLEAPWLSFHCHFHMGRIYRSRQQGVVAREHYRRALRMLEAMRRRIQFDALKVAFGKDKFEACEGFVRLCLGAENRSRAAEPSACCSGRAARRPSSSRSGKTGRGRRVLSRGRDLRSAGGGGRRSAIAMGASKLTVEAFRAIEQFRSRSLGNPASRPAFHHSREESGRRIRRQIQELRRELNSCYSRVQLEEIHRHSNAQAPQQVPIREIRRREQQLLKLFRQLEPEIPPWSLREQTPGALEEIQAALPPDGQLLEYYLAEGSVLACLLDRKGLRFFPSLSRARHVEHLLRLLRFQMSKLSLEDEFASLPERLHAHALDHLRQLYRELVGPLDGHLSGRLVIVPHGPLHYLPFHALYDGRRHLGEGHAISYAPSATVFRNCALRQRRPAAYSLVLEVGGHSTPHIPQEAEQVERLLPHTRVLRGTAATGECLRTLGERARFLHIASHGIFRADHPLFSAIQLGDGWLTLLDLYNLRLNCELATLSGCGTGRSLVLAGDEWVGLARGFLFAGAASLLASLWDINDQTTALLMSHFYRELGSGTGQAEALRRAQSVVRERHPHPYHWAPFVLIGKAA